jgi:hypothetical protein
MKRIILAAAAAAAAVLVALVVAGPAAAQYPIRGCGTLVADGIHNITTRNVACSDARSFAHKVSDLSNWYSGRVAFVGWHAYSIRFHYQPSNGEVDVRATRPNHVIHFQIGPYGVSDGGSGKCAGIPAGQQCY